MKSTCQPTNPGKALPVSDGTVAYKWLALSVTSLGALMASLNSGTLIIALPEILRDLHTSLITVLWVVMSYLLVITALVLHVGRLGDILGRRRLFNFGFLVFTAGSLLCGLAESGWQLVLFRVVQGVGGALVMANSAAVVTDAFPLGERGRALGINAMVVAFGQMLGPVLGGFLVGFGWRWVFLINIPVGVFGTFWSYRHLRDHAGEGASVAALNQAASPTARSQPASFRLDWPGTVAFLSGFVTLLIALSFGAIYGWHDPRIIGLLVYSAVAAPAFIVVERRMAHPLLDLGMFQQPGFAAATALAFFSSLTRMATMFLLVFYLQGVKGDDPVMAGILLSPLAAGLFIMGPVGGWLADRYGARWLSAIGLGINALGMAGLSRIQPGTPYATLAFWLGLAGLGAGLFNSPNTSALMSAVPPAKRGVAAGVRSLAVNTGMIFSVALALSLVTTAMPAQVMMEIFAGKAVQAGSIAVGGFVTGLQRAFVSGALANALAVVLSLLLPAPEAVRQPAEGTGAGFTG